MTPQPWLALVVASCGDPSTTRPELPVPEPNLIIRCFSTPCEQVLTVPLDDLRDCFGANAKGWSADTPTLIREQCDSAAEGDCAVLLAEADVRLRPVCGCSPEADFDACQCCIAPSASDTSEAFGATGEDLLGALGACGVDVAADVVCEPADTARACGELQDNTCAVR